jgi:Protein of unknown function (DUF1194)
MLVAVLLFVSVSVMAAPGAPAAGETALPTDANLITAIDVSGSIGPRDEALQFDGIVEAILDPDFLQTVAKGYHGRIGFAAFTWSSQGDFTMPVPWSLIESEATAIAIAARLRDALGKPRLGYGTSTGEPARREWRPSLATDLSAAIEHAMRLLANAPFAAGREVINVLANGTDNIPPEPGAARALALSRGIVINGVGLGDDAEVLAYLRTHVQGGSGSFVLQAHHPADFFEAMRMKFRMDLVGPAAPPSPLHLAHALGPMERYHAHQ